jgi:hypothetical protein
VLPRSAIPRVVGIIAMVIAPIGALWSWTAWSRSQRMASWDDADRLADTITYLEIYFVVSVALFLAHVLGGAFACAYRRLGRYLLTGYAIGALLLIVVDLYMMYALPGEGRQHDRHGWGGLVRMAASVIALPWPIVVLALINVRRARDALA